MYVLLAARARDRGQFHRQRFQIILQMTRAPLRLQALLELRILRGDADRTLAGVTVMTGAGARTECGVVGERADRAVVDEVIVAIQPSAINVP